MRKTGKYLIILFLGLIIFLLELFVLQLDGPVGLFLCIIGVLGMLFGIIGSYKHSDNFKVIFLAFLDCIC